DPTYMHLDGTQQQINPAVAFNLYPVILNIGYIYEINNRKDFWVNNQITSSFSPKIHWLEVSLTYAKRRLNAELFSTNALSYYTDKNILYPNSAFPRYVSQRSLLVNYGARLSYLIAKQIFIISQFKYERNYSNIRNFRYEKRIYQLGISWQY
ncbi:MAG: hypothetical protein R3240_14335, partial [Gammaproteobacteria bacterium]|nr:hypothetical protein [Gammaproteobacteria bacterium]